MIIILVLLAGLVTGSFVNAFTWRLQHKRNWVSERSECTHCKHVLAPKDLIPVVSWLLLKGKCRYCHKRIEDTPLTELGVGLAFAASYIFWPFGFGSGAAILLFLLWLLILCLFATLCLFDFKSYLLPDKLTLPLFITALLFAGVRLTISDFTILSTLLGGLVGFGLFFLLFQVSQGKWIGGGDYKLGAAAGILAGSLPLGFAVIFLSSLLGTLYALPQVIRHKRVKNIKVPYGPFIILATIFVVLGYRQFYELLYAALFLPYPQ